MNESKKFEFRKTRCRLDVDRILIYCTQPVGKIVGLESANTSLMNTLMEKKKRWPTNSKM